jgi:Flp pilus assembly protein TadG
MMSLRSVKCQRAQAVVELTFAFLIFMSIFFALVEFSHLLYTKLTLQNALRSAGRYMITGRTGLDGSGNTIPRPEMIRDVFCANVIATGIQCPSLGPAFTFTCLGAGGTATPCSGGDPDATVMVTVQLIKPAMTPFFSQFFSAGGVPFTLNTTWKNEPYPQS